MQICRICCFLLFIALFGCTQDNQSEDAGFAKVPLPSSVAADNVVLEILNNSGGNAPVLFDLPTIMAFPQTSFTGNDPWDHTAHKFTGVQLFPLLKRIGIQNTATRVEVIAANNYRITIGLEDMQRYNYLLSYSMDNVLLQGNPDLKKRGSLMIAINFDKYKNLDTELYKNHLVWQVKTIIVR
ncbi:MAG: hypothetical protein JW904_08645 [Spirochaetales bacterium]|nr:hypothetical protein [Spirochaetales bacterium]